MRTENTVSGKITEAALYLFVIFFPISKALIEITFTVALLAWLSSKWEKREIPKLPWNAAAMFLYAFIVLSVLSVFVSKYPVQSLRGIGKFGEEILLFVMVYDTFRTREKLRRLMAVGFVVLLAILMDALFQYATGRDLFRRMDLSYVGTNIRLIGPFNNHALFAAFLIAWLSNALSLSWGPSRLTKKERVFLLLLFLLGMFCMFHTQARSAWLSFAAALAFFALIQRQKWILAGLALATVLALAVLPRNMIIHQDAEGKEQSLVERYVLWDRALNVILARPLLGTGINTYVRSHPEFDKTQSWRVKYYYAHNSYLQLAAERGIPALLFFLGFVLCFFARALRAVRKTHDPDVQSLLRGVLAALVGLLCFALVDTAFEPMQTGLQYWFLFAIGARAMSLAGERKAVPA